jgi:hypothetical protein
LLADKSSSTIIMRFTSACVRALLAPVVIAAQLSLVKHDDHNSEHKQQQLLFASSSFSELKPADRVAIRREVRHEPKKIHNIDDDDVKDNNKKKDNPTTDTTDSKSGSDDMEECVPPITVSTTSKIDVGNIPLSSCSSSKEQICIINNINITKKSSSSIDKKTGVCTDINNVPTTYWAIGDPSYSSEIPSSYWEDSDATTDAAATEFLTESSEKAAVNDSSTSIPPLLLLSDDIYSNAHEEEYEEGVYQQQDDYYIHQYADGMELINGKVDFDLDHYQDSPPSQQQQHDERHLAESNCAVICPDPRPDV